MSTREYNEPKTLIDFKQIAAYAVFTSDVEYAVCFYKLFFIFKNTPAKSTLCIKGNLEPLQCPAWSVLTLLCNELNALFGRKPSVLYWC